MQDAKPTWLETSLCYLRGFTLSRHQQTSADMPHDRRIVRALRRLYQESSPADRAVMRGDFTGTQREKNARLNRLAHQLAVRAGLCAYAIIPPEWKETEPGNNPGESEET